MRRTRGRDHDLTRRSGGVWTIANVRTLTENAAEAGNETGKQGIMKAGNFNGINNWSHFSLETNTKSIQIYTLLMSADKKGPNIKAYSLKLLVPI